MPNVVYYNQCKNIEKIMNELSQILNIDRKELSSIETKLRTIVIGARNHTLEDMLDKYFTMLENEMANMIVEKFTPGFQFGIKNKYFTFIGYHGKFNGNINSSDIDESTYFSFDSISKILTSIVTMLMIRDGKFSFDTLIKDINPEYKLDASIEDVLKFTANIKTERRIEGLSTFEAIELLKKCQDLIEMKQKGFYEYNDIGYIILRNAIEGFLEKVDIVLSLIDPNNLTYKNNDFIGKITGGRLGYEYLTPDLKGRGIDFPGHTGLYGNIMGLLNFFEKTSREGILSNNELELLLKQPYTNPIVHKETDEVVYKNGRILYTGKLAGYYTIPKNIPVGEQYDYMINYDFSKFRTPNIRSSCGTCGAYTLNDTLGNLGAYTAGLLTNPYSAVQNVGYPNDVYTNSQNTIEGTNILVNEKGIVLGHYKKLMKYRSILGEYGILLNLITEYYKLTNPSINLEEKRTPYVRKLTKPSNH